MKRMGDSGFDNKTSANRGTLKEFKLKLIASYIIPGMFIIILGVVSFFKASEAIVSKCEKAAEATINMASECLAVGFRSVRTSAILYSNDSLFQKYSISYDDKGKAWQYRDAIANELSSRKAEDEFIKNVYLINDKVEAVSTGEGIDDGLYASFKETELAKILDDNKTENVWDGEDAFLDQQLKSDADHYSMRMVRKVSGVNGFLIVDVKADVVRNILSDLKFDKDGYLGLVTPDGKEIIDYSLKQEDPGTDMKALRSEKIFVNQPFYQEAMEGEEESGSKYVTYNGATYFFLYSKVGDTGASICALMPKSTITSQTEGVRNVTIIIVAIACGIAILIAAMLSFEFDRKLRISEANDRPAASL